MIAVQQETLATNAERPSSARRSRKPRWAFHHGFAAGATLAPIALVIYVYWHSGDAAIRARMIVGGLELTVLGLALALAVRIAVRIASRIVADRLDIRRREPIIDYVPF
jgi:hypothetical protein